ncbi:MAG: FtsQ-type POTRA domain-containing protein [Chloroflexota bacterium]
MALTRDRNLTRAEIVRKRRTKRHQQRVAERNVSRYQPFPSSASTIVARGDISGIPVYQRQKQTPRKRVDVPLGVPGAEAQLPAIPRVRIGWRLLSFVLVLGLAFVLAYLWNFPALRVKEVDFQGLQRLSSFDLNVVLGIHGLPIFAVSTDQVMDRLQGSFPDIKSVSVRVELPNIVQVTVKERQPVLAWQREGKTVWVSADGLAYTPRGDPSLPLVVHAEGPPPLPPVKSDLPVGTQRLLTPQMVLAFQILRMYAPAEADLLYHPDRGLGWEDPLGWHVYFGHEVNEIEKRLEVYQAIRDYLETEGLQPSLVSVENIHAPFYRWEQ